MYIPRALTYQLSKLSGYAQQTVKLQPLGKTNFNAGDQCIFRIPVNSMVDLSSIVLQMQVSTTSTAATPMVGLPRHSASLLQRVEVLLNGQSVSGSSLQEYGTVHNLLMNATASASRIAEQGIYALGTDRVQPTGVEVGTQVIIDSWLGLLGGSAGSCFLNTSLTGAVEVRLTFNSGAVLTGGALAQPNATFSVANVAMNVTTISFADNWLDTATASLLADSPILIPFKSYSSYQYAVNANAGQMSFSHSAESIDALYGFLRPLTYDAVGNANNFANGTSPYYNFISDGTATQFNYSVNNQQYPQWAASVVDAYSILKQTLGAGGFSTYANTITSPTQFSVSKFIFALGLAFVTGEAMQNCQAGYNTNGSQVPIVFKWSNGATGAGTRSTCVVECTSLLEIHSGQQVIVRA